MPFGVGREDFGFILKCAGIAVGVILHRVEHTETAKFFSPCSSLLPPNADRKSRRNRFFLRHLPISPSGKHAGLVQACRHNVYKSMKRESINLFLRPDLCLAILLVFRMSSSLQAVATFIAFVLMVHRIWSSSNNCFSL